MKVLFLLCLSLTNFRYGKGNLTCPPTDESSFNSWLCDLTEWAESMKEWKSLIEQDCSDQDLGHLWQDLFSCSDPINVRCCNEERKHCEINQLNCTICYCTDGKYADRKNYKILWEKHQADFRTALNLYMEKLRHCRISRSESECNQEKESSQDEQKETEITVPPSTEPTETTFHEEEGQQQSQTDTTPVLLGTDAPESTSQQEQRQSKIDTISVQPSTGAPESTSQQEQRQSKIDTTEMQRENCSSIPLDFIFVVDGSDSIGEENFNITKEWLINKTLEIHRIYGSCARVEILQYSDKDSSRRRVAIEDSTKFVIPFTLNDVLSNCDECVRKRIRDMDHIGGQTYTHYALRRAMEVEFPNSKEYNISTKIVIVVTDGQANDQIDLETWYDTYKNDVIPFAVGVGNYKHFEAVLNLIANGGEAGNERVVTCDYDQLRNEMELISYIQSEVQEFNSSN